MPEDDRLVNVPAPGVVPPIAPGEANVAPLKLDAFKFGMFVVDDTTSGAVPVATVEVSCPLTDKDAPVAAPILGVTSVGEVERTTDPKPVDDVAPVPPLATARVPARTIAPVAGDEGVRPVVPALKLVTPVAGAATHAGTPPTRLRILVFDPTGKRESVLRADA